MIRAQFLQHLPKAKKGRRGRSERKYLERSVVVGTIKSGVIREVEKEEVEGDDSVKYFLLKMVFSVF